MEMNDWLQTLEKTIIQHLCIWCAIWLLAIIVLFRHVFVVKKSKKSTKRNTKLIVLSLFLIIGIPALRVRWFINGFNDLNSMNIVISEGIYEYNAVSRSEGDVFVETDEGQFRLILPAGWTRDQFPEGEHKGTIVYSSDSHVILQFIPQ